MKKGDRYSVNHCLQPFQNRVGLIEVMMNLSATDFYF